MTALAFLAVAIAGIGLAAVRTAPPAARWAMWCACVLGAVAALALPRATWRPQPARVVAAALRTEARASTTALLGAAAAASPRAEALHVTWREPLPEPPTGPLGALAGVPPTLPFAPQDLLLQALGPAERDRPLALRVAPLPVAAPLAAELRVRRGDAVVQRWAGEVGPAVFDATFTPSLAGDYVVELTVAAGPATAIARGVLAVGDAKAVLVLEPSGLAAEALRTQGLRVAAAAAVPDDLGPFAAVVVGQPLPPTAEGSLAIAARDGLGVFVTAPGFGAEGGPVRGLLPVRPLPQPATAADGGAGAGGGAPTPPVEMPPSEPPPPANPPPPDDRPPTGDTQGRGQLSAEPIEVDKRAIAMVLVVDRSGSMGTLLGDGETKMSYAKASALRTAQALTAGDRVGLVTFGNKDEGRIELPLTDAADAAAVKAGIARLRHANEYTYLLGGLRVAVDALRPAAAAVKHLVVISDGEFDYNEELALRRLARRAREQDRITLSIITIADGAIGPSFTRAAEGLARDGGGEFFSVDKPGSVPAFVSAEVTRSLSRVGRTPRPGAGQAPTAEPPTPQPPAPTPPQPAPPPPAPEPTPPPPPAPAGAVAVVAVAESPLLAPLPALAWPSLGKVAPNAATSDAATLLAARDAIGSPVLAYANRGLGKVGVFAADLFGPAGAEFRAEAAFPARLAQWVAAVLPPQPAVAPQQLLQSVELSPIVPTPPERAAVAALAGAAPIDPIALPLQPTPPDLARDLAPSASDAAGWFVLALVLVAAIERWAATRALRRAAGA